MVNKKIFLVGMPSSGKSTIGELISERLDLPFIDLDDQIEIANRKPIPEIFEDHGEDYFRLQEQKELQKLIKSPQLAVIATGGGAPFFFDNMKEMNESGITVFIDMNLEKLMDRVRKKASKRPLLQGEDPGEKMKELYHKRIPFYRQAQITASRNEHAQKDALASSIVNILESKPYSD